jgi:hypothetical protein
MIEFIGTSLQSQSMIVYDSPHSLLYHEHLLFHSNEGRTTSLYSHIKLSYEWITTFL